MPRENDLEGAQDQGGKHGGQKGMPKPEPKPPRGPDQGIVRDEKGQEQPRDKARAQAGSSHGYGGPVNSCESRVLADRPGRWAGGGHDSGLDGAPGGAPVAAFLAHIRLSGAAESVAPGAFWRDLTRRVAFRPLS